MSKYVLVIFSVVFVTACSNSPEIQVEEEIDCWGPQVPFFSQIDPVWSGNQMGSSSCTIGGCGCLITSITMAFNYYGLYVTPAQFNDWLSNPENGGYTGSGDFANWDKISEYSEGMVWHADIGWSDLASEVDAGYPVVTQVSLPGEHWILIVGRTGETYFVLDPLSYNGGEGQLLSDYSPNGRYISLRGHDAENNIYTQAVERHSGSGNVGFIQHTDTFGSHGVHWYHGEWRSDGDDIMVQNREGGEINDFSGMVYDALHGGRKAYWVKTGFWEDHQGNGWAEAGGPHSWLGPPIGDEYWNGDMIGRGPMARQDFMHGYLYWDTFNVTQNNYPYATPGWFSGTGWDNSKSYAFAEAYERNNARNDMGEAMNTVHNWGPVEVQDFDLGSFGWCSIIHNPESNTAHVVRTGFKEYYDQVGPDALGYPCEDEWDRDGGASQNFQKASLYWNGSVIAAYKDNADQNCSISLDPGSPDFGPDFPDEGELFKGDQDDNIYYMQFGYKRWIPNESLYLACGYSWDQYVTYFQETVDAVPSGDNWHLGECLADGSLAHDDSDDKIYYIQTHYKRHIPNEQVYLDCGFTWDQHQTYSHSLISVIPTGPDYSCDEFDNDYDGDGYWWSDNDCNDEDPAINPGATEICNDGIDNDCDWQIDEADPDCGQVGDDDDDDITDDDYDGDGYWWSDNDCNDTDPAIHPGAIENCSDNVDNDCDWLIDEADPDCIEPEVDNDNDGYSEADGDCDNNNAAIHPGAPEICDGYDNNCNGVVPTDELDNDGNGIIECAEIDSDSDGYTGADGDCNDNNAAIHPGASEVSCDGVDNDCNPASLDNDDYDNDGYSWCDWDCNDTNAAIHPGAVEDCNDGIDNDCDWQTDSWDSDCDEPELGCEDMYAGLTWYLSGSSSWIPFGLCSDWDDQVSACSYVGVSIYPVDNIGEGTDALDNLESALNSGAVWWTLSNGTTLHTLYRDQDYSWDDIYLEFVAPLPLNYTPIL